jgi:hypothetical protein
LKLMLGELAVQTNFPTHLDDPKNGS